MSNSVIAKTSEQGELDRRCAYYQKIGLPATVDPAYQRIFMRVSETAAAVTVPEALGPIIAKSLTANGISGPLIAVPRCSQWVFLTGPHDGSGTQASTFARLFLVRGYVAAIGSAVGLPSPASTKNKFRREWLTQPDSPLPEMKAVVSAALTAIDKYRQRQPGAMGEVRIP